MDVDQVRAVFGGLQDDQRADRNLLREVARRVEARARLIEGYVELYPELGDDIHPDQVSFDLHPANQPMPRGQDAVEKVLQTAPGVWWTLQDVVSAMDRRGWLPESKEPAAAVRAALQRAWDDDMSLVYKSAEGRAVFWAWLPAGEEDDEGRDPADEYSDMLATARENGEIV